MLFSGLLERAAYTATPIEGRLPSIEFSSGHSDAKILDQLDSWWATASSEAEAYPISSKITFNLPPPSSGGYPFGHVALLFNKYEHNREVDRWTVVAELVAGKTDAKTGIVFRIRKNQSMNLPPAQPSLPNEVLPPTFVDPRNEDKYSLTDYARDAANPNRAGKLAMEELAHVHAVESLLRIEEMTMNGTF